MKKNKITLQNIADQLGLSKSTISRALKDHPDITEKTKGIIKNIAVQQGYQGNIFAQNFGKNRTNILGVIVPDIERPFYTAIISGIQERATQQKFFTVTCQSKDSFITEINSLKRLVSLGVDGIIICHSKETSHFTDLKKVLSQGIPVLAIDREPANVNTHFVTTDHFIAGFMIGEHLANSGYKKIAIIAGPKGLKMSADRIEGCVEGLKTANIHINDDNIFNCNFERERELSAVATLLSRQTPPDAIYCIYDTGAIEILKFLQKRNIKIPIEIGIAGCGNQPISNYLNPRLTSVDQQPYRLGELAAEILTNQIITNDDKIVRQIIRPKLIVRESTKRIV